MADDLSSDSVAPRGIDLIAGTAGKTNRGQSTQTPATVAPTNLITGVTTANPGVVTTTTAHGLVTGQLVAVAGVTGATQANGVWVVTVISATTFSVPVNVTGTFSSTGGTFTPANPGIEVSGHGTLRFDQIITAKSGTSTPTLTGAVYTSYDNGVTDTWRLVGSALTGQTAAGTVRQVFTGLDRWVCFATQVTGATPSFTLTASGELV
jgi:hypothetical protein